MRQFMVKHSKHCGKCDGVLPAHLHSWRRADVNDEHGTPEQAATAGYQSSNGHSRDGYDASSHGVRGRVTLRLPFDDTDQEWRRITPNLYQVYRVASRQ